MVKEISASPRGVRCRQGLLTLRRVAELRGVGWVSGLPVAASLRARLPETQLNPDGSGEPEVPGTGGSETHPTFANPFVGSSCFQWECRHCRSRLMPSDYHLF